MKVLVAGATGVIGRQLVPLLKAVGHEAVTLSRSRVRGADVVADALDRDATVRAVRKGRPTRTRRCGGTRPRRSLPSWRPSRSWNA